MKTRTALKLAAQRLLNLYRQAHVILGGWSVVNPIFLSEADKFVLDELKDLPNGSRLVAHIEKLRKGETPMDSVAREHLPYGGAMESVHSSAINLTISELDELQSVLINFQPDGEHLEQIKKTGAAKKFGEEWITGIRIALISNDELSEKWHQVTKTQRAYTLWDSANFLLSSTLTDRTRASVQADLPEYETYLPMFGDSGKDLLVKLRGFVSSVK